MGVAENLVKLKEELPEHVTLIAVSKTFPKEDILIAYQSGHRDFGENRVQEMTEKQTGLPEDIRWHQIGHLQTNKVKYIAPFVHLIHSVDSAKLLKEISKHAVKLDRKIRVLLQVHIAREEAKFGFNEEELAEIMNQNLKKDYPGVSVEGLMGMATFTDDTQQIRTEFRALKKLFDSLAATDPGFITLSMGMSSDYKIAIEEGSNMVRVGSRIFGRR